MARRQQALRPVDIRLVAVGDHVLLPGGAPRSRRCIYQLWLVVSANVTLQFKEGTRDAGGAVPLLANGSIFMSYTEEPWFEVTGAEEFLLNLSAAATVGGRLYWGT